MFEPESAEEMEQRVKAALESYKMPYRPCGLNADWCVSAWHIGPGAKPNWNFPEPQLYLLDMECDNGCFTVVWCKYDPDKDEEHTIWSVDEGQLKDMMYVLQREREAKFPK